MHLQACTSLLIPGTAREGSTAGVGQSWWSACDASFLGSTPVAALVVQLSRIHGTMGSILHLSLTFTCGFLLEHDYGCQQMFLLMYYQLLNRKEDEGQLVTATYTH